MTYARNKKKESKMLAEYNKGRKELTQMLRYKRPEGSETQAIFCRKFLNPIFGNPDSNGNYLHIIGDKPSVMFTAHHDTVHSCSGYQNIYSKLDILSSNSDCLGADCTSGIWLILEMIKAGIPGVYVVFAAEEVGCLGSRAMAFEYPEFLDHVQACISFDRKGKDSIVTHQVGSETCSNKFAKSLGAILGLGMKPDNTGVYTDSNEFSLLIPECTNISVGYYNQHTKKETQDFQFLWALKEALLSADWSKLVIERGHTKVDTFGGWGDNFDYGSSSGFDRSSHWRDDGYWDTDLGDVHGYSIERIVREYPDLVVDLLEQMGFTDQSLMREIKESYYN